MPRSSAVTASRPKCSSMISIGSWPADEALSHRGVAPARRQLEQKLASKHSDRTLLRAELREALQILSRHPEAGPRDPDVIGVRRLLLWRTQHHLYYRVDEAR